MITTNDLKRIVLNAQPLRERLQMAGRVREVDEALGRRRLALWQEKSTGGDPALFSRRLAWEGLTEQEAIRALGAREIDGLVIPAWATHLARAINRYGTGGEATPTRHYLDGEEPLPYEGFFVPLVDYALAEVARRHPQPLQLLRSDARADLARALLRRLVDQGSRALYREFTVRQAARRSSLGRFMPSSAAGTGAYDAFVQAISTTDLVAFLTRYAALARQLGVALEQWVVNTGRLLTRLHADWDALLPLLSRPDAPVRVAAISCDLSDLHYGGQSVMSLTFDGGTRIFYKPKDLGVDETYHALWSWFDDQIDLPFQTLRVIRRDGYGWVESAENVPCHDAGAARRYYRRSGMLLALLYALQATDCLYENIVAAGEHPILVDVETLVHHEQDREYMRQGEDELKIHRFSRDLLRRSVMRTGLLPEWYVSRDGTTYDGSGLGMTNDQRTGHRTAAWRRVNSDQMELDLEDVVLEAESNAPRVGDRALQLLDYCEDVIAGFDYFYRLLMEHGPALWAASPLGRLENQHLRFIYRNTRDYARPLRYACRPEYLRQGIERSMLFEILAPGLLTATNAATARQILIAEVTDLESGNIPHFTSRAATRELRLPNGVVLDDYFDLSAREMVLASLEGLDETDLQRQQAFIRTSIATYVQDSHRAVEVRNRAAELPDDTLAERDSLPTPALIAAAQELAAEMEARAISAPDGSLGWLVLGYDIRTERYRLQPIDFGLYNGRAGVGLFLAALHHVTGESNVARLATGALQPIAAELAHPQSATRLGKLLNIGGLAGLGSLVYALVRASAWLDDAGLLDSARRAALLITPERIAADRALDITHGTAGTLLALLALAAAGDDTALEKAVTCGEHLLDRQMPAEQGAAWTTGGPRLMTGFAHGAAGIAYALHRLGQRTSDERFLKAASAGVAFERSLYDPQERNWPDYPTGAGEEPRFMISWCHGAPGIGLARAAMACTEPAAAVCRDLERAVARTLDVGVRPLDHLCCGNLGRVELLLVAAGVLQRPELTRIAARQTATVVGRAGESGGYRLFSEQMADHVFTPGFFRGTAGIGYSLLRLARPEMLPSVLLLA